MDNRRRKIAKKLSPAITEEIERFRKKAHVQLGRVDRDLDREVPDISGMLWSIEDLRISAFSMLASVSGVEAALKFLRDSKTYDMALFKLMEKRIKEIGKEKAGKRK